MCSQIFKFPQYFKFCITKLKKEPRFSYIIMGPKKKKFKLNECFKLTQQAQFLCFSFQKLFVGPVKCDHRLQLAC